MSRKTVSGSNNGFGDVIGVALLASALLLLVAQLSFDPNDIKGLRLTPDKSTHNWIGPLGAYLAWCSFLPLGLVGYLLPWLLAAFGAAYLLNFLSYLRERLRWSLLWTVMLLISLTGLLFIFGLRTPQHNVSSETLAWKVGGALGWLTYGQTPARNFGLSLLGPLGATIIYSALCLISLLFLTNFQLGEWIRAFVDKKSATVPAEQKSPEEIVLDRRARDWKNRRKNCRTKSPKSRVPASARICSPFPNRPCAI
jgi:phosphotransferase system  glucose/maltose/N-acetylglucosamine-specific IIC component